MCEGCPAGIFDRLRHERLPKHLIEALQSITKWEARVSFVRRAAANRIGRKVKLGDLSENCDLSPIETPTKRDYARIEKYCGAIGLIEAMSRQEG